MPKLLWSDIPNKVCCSVRVAVDVTVEAGDSAMRLQRTPVVGSVELLLRRRRDKQPKTFELLGVQDAVEQFEHECLPVVNCRSSQLLTVQEMVGLKLGVSLVPEMAANVDRNKSRQYRSLSRNAPKRTIAAIWHKYRIQNPLIKEFVATVKQFSSEKRVSRY